jgi:MYXO-CTERM domain-containing protein
MNRLAIGLGCAICTALLPATASAHFYIDYPDAGFYPGPSPVPWWHQDALGSPQKLGPCGDEDDAAGAGGGPTNVVTPYAPGQTVTLQWTEVISHAGWYRIAIAADRSAFVDPPVQVDSNGNSADAGIEDPPVLPVIADGIYKHAMGASKTWPPYTITLPTTPCAKCTIQIIQVMLDHPSNLGNLPDGAPNPDGFLYHHCIDISIGAGDGGGTGADDAGATGPSSDGGVGSSSGAGGSGSGSGGSSGVAGSGAPSNSSSGCGCSLVGAPPLAGGALSLLGLVALLIRRRR